MLGIVERAQEIVAGGEWRWSNRGSRYFIRVEIDGKVYRYWFGKDIDERGITRLINTIVDDIKKGRGDTVTEDKKGGGNGDGGFDEVVEDD